MKRAGMMRSVSMSSPGTKTAVPLTLSTFASAICFSLLRSAEVRAEDFTRVGDAAADGCRRDHGRAHQHGAPGGAALAPLEVPVRRRRAELTADQLVGVHRQAHGTSGL